MVFGAGELEAFEGEVWHVGALMRATAVVDVKLAVGAVHEQAAAIAVAIGDLVLGNFVCHPDFVPAFLGAEILGAEFRNIHVEQDVDGPDDLGQPERGERMQDRVKDFTGRGAGVERARQVLAKTIFRLRCDLGNDGSYNKGVEIKVSEYIFS